MISGLLTGFADALGHLSQISLDAGYIENRNSAVAVNVSQCFLGCVKGLELNASSLNLGCILSGHNAVAVHVAVDAALVAAAFVVDGQGELGAFLAL